MSKVISQGPCPKCDSSDAYTGYDDLHFHCYSCGYTKQTKTHLKEINLEEAEDYQYVEFRGVPSRVMEKYGAAVGLKNGEPWEVVFSYVSPTSETPTGKRRILPKTFSTYGEIAKQGLYGRHVHDAASKSSITITEGELDALSVDTVVGDKTASVSVQSASSAYRDCKNDRDYINSFERIVFWFDGDKAGNEALTKCISLFDFNKVFVVTASKHKDANEYLKNKEAKELGAAWRAAKRYTPDGIISSFNDFEAALEKNQEACIATYPFPDLQHNLFGLHRGEVIVFKAPEGVGKTSTFVAMEHHILKTTDCKIAIIHLEEDSGTTIKAIAGYELNLPCVLPDSGVTNKQIFEGFKSALGGKEDRVFMHDHFGADDPDVILDNIRFLVTSCECDIVMLDHIGLLVNTQSAEDGERMKLDYISNKLKFMAKELGFCMVEIAPVNDNGETRGSRNISKVANTVISIDRNKLSDDPVERNTTRYTIEKARLGGRTGPADVILFDTETYKMRPFNETDFKPVGVKEFRAA